MKSDTGVFWRAEVGKLLSIILILTERKVQWSLNLGSEVSVFMEAYVHPCSKCKKIHFDVPWCIIIRVRCFTHSHLSVLHLG